MEFSRKKTSCIVFRVLKDCLPVLILCVCAVVLKSNDLYFKHFSVQDGLADNFVNCIFEDKYGFMWFGTKSGLSRFDGERWLTFHADEMNSNSLCGNMVIHLEPDRDGTIWIATEEGGICRYFPDKQVFKKYDIGQTSSRQSLVFLGLHVSYQGDVYLSIDLEGIHKLDVESGTFLRDSSFMDDGNQRFYSIISTENALYAGQLADGLKVVPYSTDTALKFNFRDGSYFPYPGHTPVGLYQDESGIIWSGSWDNGLYRFDEKKHRWEVFDTLGHNPLSHNDDEIVSISSLDQRLFIGTKRSGLYIYDIAEKKFSNSTHQFILKNSISSNQITQVYRDSRNLIWIATDMGLNLYSDRFNRFQTHYQYGDPTLADFGDPVTGIAPGEDLIFLTTLDKVWQSDALNINLQPFNRSYWEPSESFHSVGRSSNNHIFLGTTKTAYWFSIDNLQPKTLNSVFINELASFNFFDIFSSRIIAIEEAELYHKNIIFFSIFGHGLAFIDETSRSGLFTVLEIEGESLVGSINGFFSSAQNQLWALTRTHGILQLELENNKKSSLIKQFMSNEEGCLGMCFHQDTINLKVRFPDSQYNSRFSAIGMIEVSRDNYFIITEGSGLLNLNLSDGSGLKTIPSPHLRYEGISVDGLNRLWLVTAGGFDIYDLHSGHWHRINSKDGLPEKGVRGKIIVDRKGYFYAGSYGAFVKFNPADFTFSAEKPEVKITKFNVFDQSMDYLLSDKEVRLTFRENFLSIGFSAFNYTQSENLTYRYKLSGVNQDWVSTASETKADYTNLRGGKYTFQVQAINSNGIHSDIAYLPIYLVPPFYEQWWFFTLLLLLVALAVFAMYKYRIRQLKAVQAIRLQSEIDAQEKERSRLARDLHDDLGTRLSTLKLYISGMTKFFIKSDEALRVKKYAEELLDSSVADLRNMLLNLSPETVTKYGFFYAVQDLAAKVNHSGLIRVNLNTTGNLRRFDAAKELALYRICQELINNSLKHAECNSIDISTIIDDEQFSLLYEDNGKGMDLQTARSGYGFQNISNRLNLINGKVSWDSSPENGLRAVIEVGITHKNKVE